MTSQLRRKRRTTAPNTRATAEPGRKASSCGASARGRHVGRPTARTGLREPRLVCRGMSRVARRGGDPEQLDGSSRQRDGDGAFRRAGQRAGSRERSPRARPRTSRKPIVEYAASPTGDVHLNAGTYRRPAGDAKQAESTAGPAGEPAFEEAPRRLRSN